ncbi:hypothetical protein Mapa_014642 [Marchantia paleacea]|nr:hypothetical protein Mapa_014642 [Marchantia paleacea]
MAQSTFRNLIVDYVMLGEPTDATSHHFTWLDGSLVYLLIDCPTDNGVNGRSTSASFVTNECCLVSCLKLPNADMCRISILSLRFFDFLANLVSLSGRKESPHYLFIFFFVHQPSPQSF